MSVDLNIGKEVNKMSLPEFPGEASLYKTNETGEMPRALNVLASGAEVLAQAMLLGLP
jgi:hypothetical protein